MPDAPATHRPLLLVIATALEARAVLAGCGEAPSVRDDAVWMPRPIRDGLEMVVTGIGKTNAAAATSLALHQKPYRAVLCVGIAGSLPGSAARLASRLLASSSVYADEGLVTPAGFQTCEQMGFPLGPFEANAVPGDPALVAMLSPLVDHVGPIATVSTCSGADALAAVVRDRTGALAECMEGAAVGHVTSVWSAQRGRPAAFAELRVISNTTGDRAAQVWRLQPALESLTRLASDVSALLAPT